MDPKDPGIRHLDRSTVMIYRPPAGPLSRRSDRAGGPAVRENLTLDEPRRGIRSGRTMTLLPGLVLAGMVALTAGCGGSDDVGVPPSVSTPTLPTSIPTALPSGLPTSLPTSLPGVGRIDAVSGADALRGTNVPPDFPVPPGATVKVGTTTGKTSTVTLDGVSSDGVATFYRQTLPGAGYKITTDVGIPGVARAIQFNGHGVNGSIGAAGVGNTDGVAVVFTKQ